jgi:hypothetical protein
VRFEGDDAVMISTSYADRRISLDPGTGRPESTLGPSCSG